MKPILIVDIDHTLADAAWRDPLIGRWEEYFAESVHDRPIAFIADMVRSLAQDYYVVALTGRNEEWRTLTLRWLLDNSISVQLLLMRPDGDYRPSPVLKCAILREYFGDLTKIALAIEDRDDCVAAFRQIGINVLQVYHNGGRRDGETGQQDDQDGDDGEP